MANILVVDPQPHLYSALAQAAGGERFRTSHSGSIREGMQVVRQQGIDIVVMRSRLPDGTAREALADLLGHPSSPEVIVVSEQGDPDEAEYFISNGAWDYVVEPVSANALLSSFGHIVRYRRERDAGDQDRLAKAPEQLQSEGIIGSSPRLRECLDVVAKAARIDANVLITGESGTGKELFASAVHTISARAAASFVVVDCAALPQSLVESTLFGHEKGAFTGAESSRAGLIKQADGGTLFLDEVGELPLEMQKKFLRVLHERRFRPVGGRNELKSDFRLVAATNRNLAAMVETGEFRKDLLYRLQTFHIELPPLRERSNDIKELAYFFMSRYCRECRIAEKRFSPDFFITLQRYRWPGNVRELFSTLERAIAAADDQTVLVPKHLPTYLRIRVTREMVGGRRQPADRAPEAGPPIDLEGPGGGLVPLQEVRDRTLAAVERRYLEHLLARTAGDVPAACRIAGLSRSRLYALIKKHGVTIHG